MARIAPPAPIVAAAISPVVATAPDPAAGSQAYRSFTVAPGGKVTTLTGEALRPDEERVAKAIGRAQDFFTERGIGPDKGNGPILVEMRPNHPSASYGPDGKGGDSIWVGIDPVTKKSYAEADDILYHEYAHRIVHNLRPDSSMYGEPGSVDESLPDAFAAAIEGRNWTIGEDVVPGGLRSMENPRRRQDAERALPPGLAKLGWPRVADHIDRKVPDWSATYLGITQDGNKYLNIGIGNKAAVAIGNALGRSVLGDIYLEAVQHHLRPREGFAGLADATLAATRKLHGDDSPELQAVQQAWNSVGLTAAKIGERLGRG